MSALPSKADMRHVRFVPIADKPYGRLYQNVGQFVGLPHVISGLTVFLFGELQVQRTRIIRMTDLRIVERRKTEVISAVELVELHIVLTTGHEFA